MNKQKNVLRVATCQFAVEPEIAHNRRCILKQLAQAAESQADVVHFSETALSGYAGVDIPNIKALDGEELRAATRDIMAAAKEHQVWVVLGSTHLLDERTKPHNCLYIINPQGQIVDRYDKRFCTGKDGKSPTLDAAASFDDVTAPTARAVGLASDAATAAGYREQHHTDWNCVDTNGTMPAVAN
jgi:predicted amidohydrolase